MKELILNRKLLKHYPFLTTSKKLSRDVANTSPITMQAAKHQNIPPKYINKVEKHHQHSRKTNKLPNTSKAPGQSRVSAAISLLDLRQMIFYLSFFSLRVAVLWRSQVINQAAARRQSVTRPSLRQAIRLTKETR